MALYLGGNKVKINLNGVAYCLNIISKPLVENGDRLLSLDGFILKDSTGLYLIPKSNNVLLSLDNPILTDTNGLHLTSKEGN